MNQATTVFATNANPVLVIGIVFITLVVLGLIITIILDKLR